MKALAALGIAGGFLISPAKWLLLLLVIQLANKVSTGLAVAILKEVLRSGKVR